MAFKKRPRMYAYVPKKLPDDNVLLDTFGILARSNDEKIVLKALISRCNCIYCSAYWLKTFKSYEFNSN